MEMIIIEAAFAEPAFCKIMQWGYETCGDKPMAETLAFVARIQKPSAQIIPFGGQHA